MECSSHVRFKVSPAVHLLRARLVGLRFLERVRLASNPFEVYSRGDLSGLKSLNCCYDLNVFSPGGGSKSLCLFRLNLKGFYGFKGGS